jgi:glycosyltransferase 2 family protein
VNRLARALVTPAKLAVGALCVAMLVRSFQSTDLSHMGAVLGSIGPWVLLLAVPFAVAQALDTEAWRRILARLGHPVGLVELYPIRVALEAMTTSLPAGVVVAESVAPRLLAAHAVPPSTTVAGAGARRWLTMRSHSIYVALGALAGFLTLRHVENVPWARLGPWVVLASALLPLGASFAVSLTLGSGSRVSRLHAWLSRVPFEPFRGWLDRKRHAFAATDRGFATLAHDAGSFVGPTALLVLAWLGESVEAYVFMRLAGADLSLLQIVSFEAGLSVLRSAWFFAPAGLGAQDLGYLGVLHMLGVPDASAVGAAFLMLKRGRELAWIVMGYAWMGLETRLRWGALREKAVPM